MEEEIKHNRLKDWLATGLILSAVFFATFAGDLLLANSIDKADAAQVSENLVKE